MKHPPLCTFTAVSTSVWASLHPLGLCLSPPILKAMPFSLQRSILSLLLQGMYSWAGISTCLQHSAAHFPRLERNLPKTCSKATLLSLRMSCLLVQSCCFNYKLLHSNGKYFSATRVFTAGVSIYAILFMCLSHIILLNSAKELTLKYTFKPTQPPESREPPPLLLRDATRRAAAACWLPSRQENKQAPKYSSSQGTKS